uniref:Uncharacterized protein n=1 Tax=Pyrodinium bahamense TaxID=73915 RepID=A0A7S0A1T6_9DINO
MAQGTGLSANWPTCPVPAMLLRRSAMVRASSEVRKRQKETNKQLLDTPWEEVADGRTFKVCFDVKGAVMHEVPGRDSPEYRTEHEHLAAELLELASRRANDRDADEDDLIGFMTVAAGLQAGLGHLLEVALRQLQYGRRPGLKSSYACCMSRGPHKLDPN